MQPGRNSLKQLCSVKDNIVHNVSFPKLSLGVREV